MVARRSCSLIIVSFALLLSAGIAISQSYPTKPVRIVTSLPGGNGDFISRLIALGISGPLGQQVIVDNRPGGNIQGEIVSRAPPDGYTLLHSGTTLWLGPFLQDHAPFDPVRDFSPLALVGSSPNVLAVNSAVPATTVKELIALAKAKPGDLNYASAGAGSPNHLAAELFKAMAGINIVRISYKGAGPALSSVISGETQLMFTNTGAITPHLKSGRVRALAVTSAQRSALAPSLPTMAAAGLPGYESASVYGMFAPAKTPEPIIHRLNQEIVRVLNSAEVKEKLFNSGVESAGGSPDQLMTVMKADMARMGKVIKDAGIRGDE